LVTQQEVFDFFARNGIEPHHKVTMHTSLRALGPIENGADGLIDAMKAYLSAPGGMLLIPTHTWANVNKDQPVFDVRSTVSCIGTMAQVAAKRRDGVRSLHPTHSVMAFGQGAEEFIRGEENSTTPAPVSGWLNRMYEEGGKILLVGVGHGRNTYMHAVEERLNISNRISEDAFVPRIIDRDGREIIGQPFHPHETKGITEWLSDFYPNFKAAFEYTGAVHYDRLGQALVYVCDARKIADTMKLIWSKADHDLCLQHKDVPEEYYKAQE